MRVPWDQDEHTRAKHDLLRHYLDAAYPIFLQSHWWKSFTYAEGFAGPGIYTNGNPGSPIIAMRCYLSRADLVDTRKPVRFLFNDAEDRCVRLLKERIAAEFPDEPPPWVTVRQYGGLAADQMLPMLKENGAWGNPMFVVLDSFGSVAVPLDIIRRIARNPGGEVLVTLSSQWFARFATSLPDDADQYFADTQWRQVATLPSNEKRAYIVEQYRRSLRSAGFSYILAFDLIDEVGNELHLVFGTSHPTGLEKMKEAMWLVDPISGGGYRDPRDPDQEMLAIELEPDLTPLRRELLQKLQSDGEMDVESLQSYALLETIFKRSQVIKALRKLRDLNKVTVSPTGRIVRASRVRSA